MVKEDYEKLVEEDPTTKLIVDRAVAHIYQVDHVMTNTEALGHLEHLVALRGGNMYVAIIDELTQ